MIFNFIQEFAFPIFYNRCKFIKIRLCLFHYFFLIFLETKFNMSNVKKYILCSIEFEKSYIKLHIPYLAALLIAFRRSLDPYSILQTSWPLCIPNIRHEGQIILKINAIFTNCIDCNNIHKLYCVLDRLQCLQAIRLNGLNPSVALLLLKAQ